jgi:hypothetical protein
MDPRRRGGLASLSLALDHTPSVATATVDAGTAVAEGAVEGEAVEEVLVALFEKPSS